MSATAPEPEEATPLVGPPEEEFWERYNSHLEFPLSCVGSVLYHVVIASVIIFGFLALLKMGADKSSVGVKLMGLDGMDEFGAGSMGSGGQADPLVERMNEDPATAAVASLADPSKLPEIKEEMQKTIRLIDPTGNLPVTNANAAAYAGLDKAVRDRLLGANRGEGPGKGKGADGSQGTGPGGTGANSTLGRNMRWTLRFKVESGRDYLNQLKAMGAKILIPIPNTDNSIIIEDLGNPSQRRTVPSNDLGKYAGLLKFVDNRRDVVNGVLGTLDIKDVNATAFCAVFTKEIEADLARKETNFRNRRPEDIEETVFRVIVRGGEFEVVVDEQKAKR